MGGALVPLTLEGAFAHAGISTERLLGVAMKNAIQGDGIMPRIVIGAPQR